MISTTRFIIVVCLLSCCFLHRAAAQVNDTLLENSEIKKPSFLKQAALPVSLITVGSLLSGSSFERNLNDEIQARIPLRTIFQPEDYSRYVPLATQLTANVLGVKARNHWFDQAKNTTISWLVTDVIVFRLKAIVSKGRPFNPAVRTSFPSGHTSFAFTTASVLYKEYSDTSPVLAYSGYLFATSTGGLRMARNAHWLSDVMVGAGIAMLVTELVYHFDHLWDWNPFKKNKEASVLLVPHINNNIYGVHFAMQW